eukprot:1194633-Prorocentrum_minimum.AAC.15
MHHQHLDLALQELEDGHGNCLALTAATKAELRAVGPVSVTIPMAFSTDGEPVIEATLEKAGGYAVTAWVDGEEVKGADLFVQVRMRASCLCEENTTTSKKTLHTYRLRVRQCAHACVHAGGLWGLSTHFCTSGFLTRAHTAY